MSSKSSGTYMRLLGEGGGPSVARGLRASPRATPGVTLLATVGVGGGELHAAAGRHAAPSSSPAELGPDGLPARAERAPPLLPPRPSRPLPPVRQNQPTRIFTAPALPPAARDAAPRDAASRRSESFSPKLAHTFAAPSFSGAEASAPLLRAFAEPRPGVASWSTAKTVVAPLSDLEASAGGATAPVAPAAGGEPEAPRRPSARRRRGALRPSLATAKLLLAALVTTAVVVGAGRIVLRGGAARVASGRVSAGAAVPAGAASVASDLGAFVEAASRTPSSAPGDGKHAEGTGPEPAAAPEPSTTRAPTTRTPTTRTAAAAPPLAEPRRAPDGSAAPTVTLARQAVDALLAGDRQQARLHYAELSRQAPDLDVYSTAVRLLAPPAPDSPP